jgi:hypothetical protein
MLFAISGVTVNSPTVLEPSIIELVNSGSFFAFKRTILVVLLVFILLSLVVSVTSGHWEKIMIKGKTTQYFF